MDTNAHHSDWGSPRIDPKGNLISNWIDDNDLVLLNNEEPTFMSNVGTFSHIDLTNCSSNIASEMNWKTYHDTLNSDHFPIINGGMK